MTSNISTVKERVITMIQRLPENVTVSDTVSDIMAELYFRQKVDAGLKELDEGKGISHEEVREQMKKWLS